VLATVVREVLGTTTSLQVFPQAIPVKLVAGFQMGFSLFWLLRGDLELFLLLHNSYPSLLITWGWIPRGESPDSFNISIRSKSRI
jgi:hypothetical protein